VPVEAVNVAVVPPVVTETDAGTVRLPLALLAMITLVPAVAALLSVMVQVVDAFEPREAAVHCSPLTRIGAARETDADFEEPFRLEVTDALWSDGIVPADAVKSAVVVPAATLTEAGTVRIDVALLDNATVVAFTGALERVTVHCVVVFCVSDEAVHCNAETVMGTSVTVTDWLVPFRVAKRWAVPEAVKAVLLAAKVALVALAATVTEVGTVRLELSEDRVTGGG
jgi:hypothetical protein